MGQDGSADPMALSVMDLTGGDNMGVRKHKHSCCICRHEWTCNHTGMTKADAKSCASPSNRKGVCDRCLLQINEAPVQLDADDGEARRIQNLVLGPRR